MSSSTFPKVKAAILKWLQDVRDKNGVINGVQLMERAAEFAVLIPDEKHFKASTGWLKGFMKRAHQEAMLTCSSSDLHGGAKSLCILYPRT